MYIYISIYTYIHTHILFSLFYVSVMYFTYVYQFYTKTRYMCPLGPQAWW